MTERESLGDARVRVDEIRAENHQGDVSASDIHWLCEIAEAALRLDATWAAHGFIHNHVPDALRLHEVLNG